MPILHQDPPFCQHIHKEWFSVCIIMASIQLFQAGTYNSPGGRVFWNTPAKITFYQMKVTGFAPLPQLWKYLINVI